MSEIALRVEFSGGLELLFDKQKSHRVSVPARVPSSWTFKASTKPITSASLSSASLDATTTLDSGNEGTSDTERTEEIETKPADVHFLIHWLKDHLLRERVELFIEQGTVCVYHLCSISHIELLR
jgi:ubiquitin related modifier 1